MAMPRKNRYETPEEADERVRRAADKLLLLLHKHHPDYDQPGIQDFRMYIPKFIENRK